MNSAEIYEILKQLTLDYMSGGRERAATVVEVRRRIEGKLIYDMDPGEALRDFLTQVYVSLENMTSPDFPPSVAEMQYFKECFEGKREFKLEEVREFTVESRVEDIEAEKARRPLKDRNRKPYARPNPNHKPRSGRINR